MAEEVDTKVLVMSNLQMIECAYDITVTNKDEICTWIMSATYNPREVLTVALALNTWVAVNNPGRQLTVSRTIIEQIIAGTVGRW
jgi:hypothetical protein